MAQQNALDGLDPTYGMQDPDELWGKIQQQDMTDLSNAHNPQAKTAAQTSLARDQGFGNPQVLKAAAMQSRMKRILEGVNEDAPADEDPLDAQARLAHAVGIGMMDLNPQVAAKALGQLAQIKQAKLQQSYLGAETEHLKSQTMTEDLKNQILKNSPASILLAKDLGKDANGLPLGLQAVNSFDLKDDATPQAIHDAMTKAQKADTTLIPMSPKDYTDGKVQTAITRGEFANRSATIAALARIQTANQKGAGQGDRFADRMMSSAEGIAVDAENIAQIPFGTTTSPLGNWASTAGHSILEAPYNALRNKLTSQDAQMYLDRSQGMFKSLAMIESQGGLQGGQALSTMARDALEFHPGDTPLTIMDKMATLRQRVEAYMQNTLAKPNIPEEQKAVLRQAMTRLEKAIPYTPSDVVGYTKAANGNNKLSFGDYVKQKTSGGGTKPTSFATEAEAEAAASRGDIKAGDSITVGGVKGKWQ